MAQYKTPGVYVKEVNSFGSSIVASPTAVPVFIGFTEKMTNAIGEVLPLMPGSENVYAPVLVRSVLEYSQSFGEAEQLGTIEVVTEGEGDKEYYTSTIVKGTDPYTRGFVQPAIANYFANGGGSCYIISLGQYSTFSVAAVDLVDMETIKLAINMAEESTLILPTDLIRYNELNYYNFCNQFIEYCGDTLKQFCVLDVIMSNPTDPVLNEQDPENYRTSIGTENLKFAGAYYPYLKSLTPYVYEPDLNNVTLNGVNLKTMEQVPNSDYKFSGVYVVVEKPLFDFNFMSATNAPKVTVTEVKDGSDPVFDSSKANTMAITYSTEKNSAAALNSEWAVVANEIENAAWTFVFLETLLADGASTIAQDGTWITDSPATFPYLITYLTLGITEGTAAIKTVKGDVKVDVGITETTIVVDSANGNVTITLAKDQTAQAALASYKPVSTDLFSVEVNSDYSAVKVTNVNVDLPLSPVVDNGTIESVKTYLASNYINMPASPFMAGIYSRLDDATGVWTPPANIAPIGISGPVVNLTSQQQENFNVNAKTGKSINAIRNFTGKGTLVWGARTNDGNSLDWRYINVKRLFISMETDIRIALEAYVFKPNVFNTWVEVKTMIDSYLFGLYKDGAFAGQTVETSYQVLIGVGETMTEEDVLNGLMKASIQVAPVRPAEFIELTFSQLVAQ